MSTPQTPPARKRIALLALCLAAFIISLDVTIVNVARWPIVAARAEAAAYEACSSSVVR